MQVKDLCWVNRMNKCQLLYIIFFSVVPRPADSAAALVRKHVQHQQRGQPLQHGQPGQGHRGQEEEEEELGRWRNQRHGRLCRDGESDTERKRPKMDRERGSGWCERLNFSTCWSLPQTGSNRAGPAFPLITQQSCLHLKPWQKIRGIKNTDHSSYFSRFFFLLLLLLFHTYSGGCKSFAMQITKNPMRN